MRYIKLSTIIIFTIVIVLVCGCTDLDNYVPLETYTNEIALYENQLEEANNTIDTKDSNIADLEEEKSTLETTLNLTEEELIKYKSLINNLNELLNCVYRIECTNAIGGIGDGTAFSIKYNQDMYVISSGHIVDNENGIFSNFRIKTNNGWVYLELLDYEITSTVPDYSIFYSEEIDNGLEYDLNNTEPDYRLGINKLIQENNNWGIDGECGSPIVNLDGEVIGLHVGYLSDIDNVLEAIDNLKE